MGCAQRRGTITATRDDHLLVRRRRLSAHRPGDLAVFQPVLLGLDCRRGTHVGFVDLLPALRRLLRQIAIAELHELAELAHLEPSGAVVVEREPHLLELLHRQLLLAQQQLFAHHPFKLIEGDQPRPVVVHVLKQAEPRDLARYAVVHRREQLVHLVTQQPGQFLHL